MVGTMGIWGLVLLWIFLMLVCAPMSVLARCAITPDANGHVGSIREAEPDTADTGGDAVRYVESEVEQTTNLSISQ